MYGAICAARFDLASGLASGQQKARANGGRAGGLASAQQKARTMAGLLLVYGDALR
jgi:hypothetical protein